MLDLTEENYVTTKPSCNEVMMIPGKRMLKFLSLSILALLLAACASNPQATRSQSGNIRLDDIKISEEYGVDAEVKLKFDEAVIRINEEQYEDAISLLLEVTDKTNKHSAPYVNLGIAYARIGKIQDAEESLLTALKINPTHPVTQNELGMVYRKTGRFSEARKVYENVLKQYPQFLPARKNVGILCDIFMNDLECAIEHYQAYLQAMPTDESVKIWLSDLNNRVSR